MKKFLSILIMLNIIFLHACSLTVDEEGDMSKETNLNDIISTIKFESGTYYSKNWNETIGTYEQPVVPDKETAIEIAKAIYKGMNKSKSEQKYVPQYVFYDEQDEIWIVSFWKETDDIVGGGCSIAIQKSDGKVLRIWYGE